MSTARVVGTGLLGTSIALALRERGWRVLLADPSPTSLALARDVGAGEPDPGGVRPDLVVVASPPDVTAGVVAAELAAHPAATVTDVASVKAGIAAELLARGADLSRYVGGHPMAGRERSGPVAARADLFLGRPWVVCPTEKSDPARVEAVRELAAALGASVVAMPAAEHDAAVALVSHVPQVAASLVAARLGHAPDAAVGLAGQGLRDVTRIAGSDPTLWAQILAGNAAPVLGVLRDLARVVSAGNAGRDRIPGKHGEPPTTYAVVTVLIPDRPGQLGRLFHDIGEAGVNVEEFSLEHAPGQRVGLAEVSVLPAAREALEDALAGRGWHVVA